MELGKSIEQYLATNIFYILPTALAWTFFIEVFKQVLKNSGYVDIGADRLQSLFQHNRDAVIVSVLLFLGIAYQIMFKYSSSSLLDVCLTLVVGALSISLFAATRLSRRTKGIFGTDTWFETSLTAWMMMLFALFIVFSILALITRLFPTISM